jgi:hypothetical protein
MPLHRLFLTAPEFSSSAGARLGRRSMAGWTLPGRTPREPDAASAGMTAGAAEVWATAAEAERIKPSIETAFAENRSLRMVLSHYLVRFQPI